MGYIDDALDEVKRATPTIGVNVCIYDDFEDVGDKLETIGNFDTVEEAQDFIDNYEGEAELVMYEAEVYEAEEKGTSDGAKKGWLSRQQGGKTKLNTRLPSYTPQKNHSISNYISMAEDDYEKGTTRDNDEYEKINYHSNSKFNAPHRTIYEEKLNKNGTGIQRATRGVNPEKTKAKVLEFVYVSKSECDICKQYDGKTFGVDSPNRPIIPRLESQGDGGSRPYTHPNCKCKWVRPFSYAGITNFEQTKGSEDYHSITASLYKYAHSKYGNKFDSLPKSRKHYILMKELMRQLKSDESFDPTSLPIASMLKMTFDAIQPTIALQLAKMKHHHRHSNEVRDLIDDMVGESLTSERKHKIVTEHNLDFTFENLLELTTLALFEAYSDEHDVWDEETNMLVDPSLLEDKKEDKKEGDEGIDDEPYMPDVYGIDPYPHRHEFIDNDCIICDYVLKASEYDSSYYYDTYNVDGGAREDDYYYLYCLHCDKKVYINYGDVKGSYDKMDEHIKVHFEEEGESKATEDKYQPSEYDLFDDMGGQDNDPYLICKICKQRVNPEGTDWFATRVNHLNIHGIQNLNDVSDWLHANESKATEGGRGSGRKGHQKWMLGAEADPEECPNCMIYTEKKDGNCQICGNSY